MSLPQRADVDRRIVAKEAFGYPGRTRDEAEGPGVFLLRPEVASTEFARSLAGLNGALVGRLLASLTAGYLEPTQEP